MRLLLDTCSFLWITLDSSQFSRIAATAFLDERSERYLSVASAWEIAIKYATGRLPIPDQPDRFVPAMRDASGIKALELDEESALLAGKLPMHHADPFDRMLVAQAIVHGMTIVTPDLEIAKYPVRVLW